MKIMYNHIFRDENDVLHHSLLMESSELRMLRTLKSDKQCTHFSSNFVSLTDLLIRI